MAEILIGKKSVMEYIRNSVTEEDCEPTQDSTDFSFKLPFGSETSE